jgi:hypothetical protein
VQAAAAAALVLRGHWHYSSFLHATVVVVGWLFFWNPTCLEIVAI